MARELVNMELPYVVFHTMRLRGLILAVGDHFEFSPDFEAFLNEWLINEAQRFKQNQSAPTHGGKP